MPLSTTTELTYVERTLKRRLFLRGVGVIMNVELEALEWEASRGHELKARCSWWLKQLHSSSMEEYRRDHKVPDVETTKRSVLYSRCQCVGILRSLASPCCTEANSSCPTKRWMHMGGRLDIPSGFKLQAPSLLPSVVSLPFGYPCLCFLFRFEDVDEALRPEH